MAEPLGSARTNANGPTVVDVKACYDESLMLFAPSLNEIIVVPQESTKAFMQEANEMEALYRALASARESVIDLENKVKAAKANRVPNHVEIDQLETKLKKAQNEYDKAYEDVDKKLGKEGYLATSGNGKELLELIPLWKRKNGGKPREWGRKWTYIRSDKMRNHWRGYKLSKADQGKPAGFLKDGKIDSKALKEQFTKLEPKLKAEWEIHTAGVLSPNLQAWAETMNIHANEKNPVQFSAGVQLFRYFAGCGAGGEWNPKAGKIAGKLNGKAELMLAHGECKAEGFLPDAEGWAWALTGVKTGTEYLIGTIRLAGSLKLEAAAGASVAAELSLEVDYSGAIPKAKGSKRSKNVDATGRKIALEKVGAEANAGVDAFAGVKAGCALKGAVQFKNPEKGEDFEDMVNIGPKVEGQFGVGAAASLLVTYKGGKFRIKAKAGLCLGPGAKGELGLEVDTKQIGSFLCWLFHAVLNANCEILEVVQEKAYIYATQLQVLLVNGVTDAYKDIEGKWETFSQQIDKEGDRVALMNRVLSNPPELRICTPEAHGILLYQLTRHSKLTEAMPQNTGLHFELLGNRKEAVLQVCRWAQTKRQFENMVQHMSADGSKGGFQGNLAGLKRFLEIGPLNSSYDDKLQAIYDSLPTQPARGRKVAMNDTQTFKMNHRMGDSPVYLAMLDSQNVLPGNVA